MSDETDTRIKQFTLERVFDAPRDVVWRAWTDPDEATHWLHPRGVTSPREFISMDVREGGTYSYTMVADGDGSTYPTGGTYLEVREPERLVFTWGNPGDAVNAAPVVTLTFEEEGGAGLRTKMTFHIVGVDGRPGDGNFYDGWVSALDLLGEHTTG